MLLRRGKRGKTENGENWEDRYSLSVKQLDEISCRQLRVLQNRSQQAGSYHLAGVNRDRRDSTVRMFEEDVTAPITRNLKP